MPNTSTTLSMTYARCQSERSRRLKKRFFLGTFCFLYSTICTFSQQKRIENEHKLSLPDSSTEQVWKYLQQNYQSNAPFLVSLDSNFRSKFSIEIFIDQYFDTEDSSLQKKQFGIRHRIRKVVSDTTDKKHNKELIQVKINSIDTNILNRGEYKFPVQYYSIEEDSLNHFPFLGMVVMERRLELISLLKSYNIDAYTLLPAIKLIQNRRRVYISKDSVDFATISLDEVTAELGNNKDHFTEIELELNEIAYTNADSNQRYIMELVSMKMKNHLLSHFPFIVQDQTPKYSKAYNLLSTPKTQASIQKHVPITIQYIIVIFIVILSISGIIIIRNQNS